jgi:hypothetical protein
VKENGRVESRTKVSPESPAAHFLRTKKENLGNRVGKQMIFLRLALAIALLLLVTTSGFAQGGSAIMGLNRIEGRVTTEAGTAIYNAYVELYSDLGSMVSRARTTGSGTFSFRGMGPGRYTIVVKPFGTNLLEESRDIEVNNQNSRNDMVYVDVRLREDKRFAPPKPDIADVVYAQEIPADAKHLYIAAMGEMTADRARALADLEESIRLFPSYFDALRALGKAHILTGEYDKGYPYLLRAIDVYRRCPDCYYSLGLAFYKLDQITAGIKAIDAAALLNPGSTAVQLLKGILYARSGDTATAEKALLAANTLAKGGDAETHWQLARLYSHAGRNADAIKELEEYLKLRPDLTAKDRNNVQDLIQKLKKPKT